MNTMKAAIATMKETVKRGTAESQAIRLEIEALKKVPDTGDQRYKLWDNKRNLKWARRYELLAYGALRGVAYERMEAEGGSEPYAPNLFDMMAGLADEADQVRSGKYNSLQSFKLLDERTGEIVEWTKSRVTSWIKGEQWAQEVVAA